MALLYCDREWSTDVVGPRERFAFWREAVVSALVPLDLEQKCGAVFSGRIVAHALDNVHVIHGACPPHLVNRTRDNISRSSRSFFYLICPVRGSVRIEQLGHSALIAEGECGLTMSDEPFRMDFVVQANSMTVQIPRELLTDRLPAIRECLGINLARESSTGAALTSLVHSLPGNRLRANLAGSAALTRMLIDFIAISAREARCGENGKRERRRVGGADVAGFIESNLANSLLSPTRAARALGISERSVHAAMKELGESFMGYVRARRVERAAKLLRDSLERHTSITTTALNCGFSDISTFNRTFRDRFCMTPRDYARRNQDFC